MRFLKALGARVAAATCGTMYATFWAILDRLTDRYGLLQSPEGSLLYIALAFGVTLLLVAALVRFTEWGSQISIPFFLIGVAIGVVYDALSDKKIDRNLFPIEAALACAIFAPALGFGKKLGAWLKKNRQANADGKPLNSPAGSS